jgi:RND family efflux transporter MFP subunit
MLNLIRRRRRRSSASSGRRPAVLAVSLASLVLLAGCARKTATAKEDTLPPPLSVRVMQVTPSPLEEQVEITGNLVSAVAVDVKTEVPGRIMTMLKEEGDSVQQGELVAQLDESNALLGVEQAEANLETAVAALERTKIGEEHSLIESERAQKLIESGGITDRDFELAKMALKDARAQLRLAEAQVGQARQAVAMARKRLADCRVHSPIRGQIERKNLNQGTYVDGGVVLYRIVDNQKLELHTYVSSTDLARLKPGQVIRFSVSSFPEAFEARIKVINPSVQSQNRSVLVQGTVPNSSQRLKAGMFARGWIVTGVKPQGLLVPGNAVWRRPNQRPFVFVVKENRAQRRDVRLGLEQAGGLEIVEGVTAGDLIVTEQYLELADGSIVSPLS